MAVPEAAIAVFRQGKRLTLMPVACAESGTVHVGASFGRRAGFYRLLTDRDDLAAGQTAAVMAALPSASANATGTAFPIQPAMRFLAPMNS